MALMRVCALLVAAAIGVAGCGSDSSGTDKMVRTGPTQPQAAADGRLTSNPSPLTLEDLDKLPKASAQLAVMETLFWAQWGNIPALAQAYHPQVVEDVGVSRLTDTYAWLRPQLLRSRMRLISARRNGREVFVAVEMASMDGPPSQDGFVLRQLDGGWRIVYDTLLDRGLSGYVAFLESRNPPDRAPDQAAVRAGQAAARKYRESYVSREVAAEIRRNAAARRATPAAEPTPTPAGSPPAG